MPYLVLAAMLLQIHKKYGEKISSDEFVIVVFVVSLPLP